MYANMGLRLRKPNLSLRTAYPDPRLEKRLYLLKEHHINFQLAQAQDARDKSLIDQLQTQLEALHIERLEHFVQRDQNNLQYRYDLGKALLNGRKWKEAIAQLEFASHQRNRRIRSLIYLSEAYIALAEPEKARFQLRPLWLRRRTTAENIEKLPRV